MDIDPDDAAILRSFGFEPDPGTYEDIAAHTTTLIVFGRPGSCSISRR